MGQRLLDATITPAYTTAHGNAYCGDSLELLGKLPTASVNLVMTSPPFALQRQKAYGNKDQDEYLEWLTAFAREVRRVLKDDGSFVLDLGGAYEKGVPTRSLYNFRVLIKFCDELGFFFGRGFLLVQSLKASKSHRMGQQTEDEGERFREHHLVV